ncbi:unnamed protein product, partial [Mesorhabditis spiculigera]
MKLIERICHLDFRWHRHLRGWNTIEEHLPLESPNANKSVEDHQAQNAAFHASTHDRRQKPNTSNSPTANQLLRICITPSYISIRNQQALASSPPARGRIYRQSTQITFTHSQHFATWRIDWWHRLSHAECPLILNWPTPGAPKMSSF